MVGTKLIHVHFVLATCAQKRPTENRAVSAKLPPQARGESIVTTNALMW